MKNFLLLFVVALLFCQTSFADNFKDGQGKPIAADEVSNTLFPRVKIVSGANDTANDVSTTDPLPVDSENGTEMGGVSSASTDNVAIQVVAAGGANTYHYIQGWTVSNLHTTVGTDVELLCGSTVKALCPGATNYGGCVRHFRKSRKCAVNEAVNCRNVVSGASVRCSVDGVTKGF